MTDEHRTDRRDSRNSYVDFEKNGKTASKQNVDKKPKNCHIFYVNPLLVMYGVSKQAK